MKHLPSLANFDFVAGLYVFCTDYHYGMDSRLYRILCRLTSHPYHMRLSDSAYAAIRRGKDDPTNDWEDARIVYRELKRRFKGTVYAK
jgi:hypothetical protein